MVARPGLLEATVKPVDADLSRLPRRIRPTGKELEALQELYGDDEPPAPATLSVLTEVKSGKAVFQILTVPKQCFRLLALLALGQKRAAYDIILIIQTLTVSRR